MNIHLCRDQALSRFNSLLIESYIEFVLFFLIKRTDRFKSVFFYLLTVMLLGLFPELLKADVKKKILGFFKFIQYIFFFNFILLYLPTLNHIYSTESLCVNKCCFFVFDSFPFLYEVDNICERNSRIIDYFLDYKILLFIKLYFFGARLNEMLLRALKLPLVINSFDYGV